ELLGERDPGHVAVALHDEVRDRVVDNPAGERLLLGREGVLLPARQVEPDGVGLALGVAARAGLVGDVVPGEREVAEGSEVVALALVAPEEEALAGLEAARVVPEVARRVALRDRPLLERDVLVLVQRRVLRLHTARRRLGGGVARGKRGDAESGGRKG